MICIVCGDRRWNDIGPIRRELEKLPAGTTIIEGGQAWRDHVTGRIIGGADALAARAAQHLGLEHRRYRADWRRYGPAAGPIRNQQMLDEEKPDLVLAFHPDLKRSRGTVDMIERARAAGVEVRIFKE